MTEQQQKDTLHNEVLKYMGKTLKKDGVRKDKDGNDVPWKLWKLEFATDGQYTWKVSCFDSLSEKSVQVKDMVEGNFYEIVYKHTEFQHPEHGLVKSKQAVLIKPSTSDKATTGKTEKQATAPTEEIDYSDLIEQYFSQVPAEQQNQNHFVGTMILSTQPKDYAHLVDAFQAHKNK